MSNAATPEPNPIRTANSESIAPHVLQDLKARVQKGLNDYGVPLETHNGRKMLVDLYQELLDAVFYMKGALMELHPDTTLPLTDDTEKVRAERDELLAENKELYAILAKAEAILALIASGDPTRMVLGVHEILGLNIIPENPAMTLNDANNPLSYGSTEDLRQPAPVLLARWKNKFSLVRSVAKLMLDTVDRARAS